MKTQYGTPYYQAPEQLESREYDDKVDMWSVGVILFQMLTGFLPFPAQDRKQLRARVTSGKYQLPDDVQLSNVCLNLIQSLIRVDPA